jgi:dynein heavy chain 1
MDVSVHTNGMNGDAVPAAPVEPSASFNPDIFRKYLLALLPPVIGADPEDLHTLFDEEFNDRVARFVNESGGVIYVVKSKEESEGSFFSLSVFLHL